MSAMNRTEKVIGIISIALVLLTAVLLRVPTFFLAHSNNDELIYTNLAMKIDKYGWEVFSGQYNNFYSELRFNKLAFWFIPAKEKEASFVRHMGTIISEREPLSHHPPGVSLFLALSHRFFYKNAPYVLFRSNTLGLKTFYFQFYAAFVPFLFSILTVLLTYILGRMLFSSEVGLMGAFIMGLTPTALLTAQKIWADDMVAFFVLSSVILYLLSLKKQKLIFAAFAGLCCGISMMAKLSGAFIIIVIGLFYLYQNRTNIFHGGLFAVFLEKRILIFLLFSLIGALPWLIALKNTYGASIFLNSYEHINAKMPEFSGFLKFVYNRPLYVYFVTIPYQFLVYVLGYFSVLSVSKKDRDNVIFLVIWYLTLLVLLTLRKDKEERYILPALPALAILSGYCLDRLKTLIKKIMPGNLFYILDIFVLFSAFFAIRIGLLHVFRRSDIIPFPF